MGQTRSGRSVARAGVVLSLTACLTRGAVGEDRSQNDSTDDLLTYGIEHAFSSRFLFRGQTYSPGPVSQTTVWGELGALSFYGWSNVLLDADPRQPRLSEVDFGVSYAIDVGTWTIEPALDRYIYRTTGGADEPPTFESSLKISRQIGPVIVFSEPVLDLQRARGAFFLMSGFGDERSLAEKIALKTTLRVGWASARYNDAYLGAAKSALHHVGLDLALSQTLSARLYLELQLEIIRIMDAELRRSADHPQKARFGVVLGLSLN